MSETDLGGHMRRQRAQSSIRRIASWLFWLPMSAACAMPKAPVVPLASGPPNPKLYDQYRLTADIGVFSAKWKRADGEYNWVQLDQVAAQFPESADVYGRATTRGTVLSVMGGAGGAIIGATLGWNLAASNENEWPTSTQVALYTTGGVLIVTALVVGLVWHNPAEDFAEIYNGSLRRHVGMQDSLSPRKLSRPVWFPQQLGTDGFGWRF